ncbi:MAG: tRNA (adenosine(37)-N6)-threonylcarbamoyltransferase complex ATPase subunit type 1 TsaE [Candidatus Moranbacteria bacterium]|nr:tRNA (adenosine(37)-N6)-threonylcarbamoyltransferase complex ATPase subunit type 1 TsaE [Candidatus Moranbacteria bacterium]
MEVISESVEDTRRIAAGFVANVSPGSVVALFGDLGAGKTAFSAGILSALGAKGPFQSPTFVIMHRYDLATPSAQGIRRIYHIDAYRIDDPEELRKLGFEEWISDPEGLVLIEWPERLGDLLPEDATRVSLSWVSETERKISWKN